jgi:carboxymethylenebutenolidase
MAVAEHNYIGATTSWVDVGDGTRASLAVPKAGEGPFPAVILGHERYGLAQHTLDLTAKLGSYGYICVSPDMASHWPGDKEALSRGDTYLELTDEQIQYYYGLSLDYLLNEPRVDSNRIAAMGVCQSGGYPLLANSVRHEIKANIVVYGGTWSASDSVIAGCNAPILGIFGEADNVISVEHVDAFRAMLQRHNKNYEIKLYAGMPHGWFNDTMPGRYRQRGTEEAWFQIIHFMERVYAGAYPPNRIRWSFESDFSTSYDFTKNVRLA